MQPLSPAVPVFRSKLWAESFSAMQIFQQPRHATASHQKSNNKTFQIIHPFHPYRNIEFEVDHVRWVPGGCRVFFFNTKGRKSSVPFDWTDIGPKDPFVTVSAGRTLFRVEDLLGLVRLIEEIRSACHKWAHEATQWGVKENMPLMLNQLCRIISIEDHDESNKICLNNYYCIVKWYFSLTK